jgi:methylenetetrahydrofolate dehydrogenase (NADP+)/methenyltetrahydrofolate cyclohydrolase
MKLLDGKKLSDEIKDCLKLEVQKMKEKNQNICLAVIQVGDNEASNVYVRNKEKACEYVGIKSKVYKLNDDVPSKIIEDTLLELISLLNKDKSINGILVQLPLPKGINEDEIIQAIAPEKDVDGFHELNVGKLVLVRDVFAPCTANGIIELLLRNHIDVSGKNCVVVGRSNIVGKPTATMLLQLDGTVTICHSKTKNLKEICKNADILVCAIGKPKFFNKEYIKEGAVVVDVGIHRTENGLCGDVDFDDVKDIVSAITPVPRGVGAMTVAMLMLNCVEAARMQYGNYYE